MMTYEDTLEYMYQNLPMFHRIGKSAYRADLSNAFKLDEYFNYPHRNYNTIHIAGTNGKGSVAHMLAAILQESGYKTGLFTSPHLKDFRERIRINGQMIPKEDVVSFIAQSHELFQRTMPSFFEMTSALAFYYFSESKVDVAVIEVGMGGRLDSTNIITPQLSIITNIGLDHTEYLGDTLAKIAVEKAGIIKNKVPVVIGEFNKETWPVFARKCSDLNTKAILADSEYIIKESDNTILGRQILDIYKRNKLIYKDIELDLKGLYQQKNICTVLAAADNLLKSGYHITDNILYEAAGNVQKLTGLMGRWQLLSTGPLIICDTGHNAEGIYMVMEQIKSLPYKKLHIVIGFVNDKDIQRMLKLLPQSAVYYFTNANIPRALNAEELKNKALALGLKGESYKTVKVAIKAAKEKADTQDMIFHRGE